MRGVRLKVTRSKFFI